MAGETFELYALTSKLTLDTSQFDRAYGTSRAKMTSLHSDLQRVQTQSGISSKALGTGLGGALDSVASSFGIATGAAGAFTAGLSIGVGIYVSAGKAIFELADSTAKAQGKFHDLANETNFSVEFLSGLSPLAIAAGKDVDDLSTSLGIFQKNLVKGGEAFKILGITSKDNEEALKQAARGLNNVKDGAQQTALAMEVFGRSGRAMLAVIKDNNGNLEAAQKFWKKWGLAISAETAAAADDFGDGMDRIGLRLTGIKQQIGQEAIPAFNSLFSAIEAALDANQTNWKWWGEQVAKIILTVGAAMGGFAKAISNLDPKNPLALGKFIQDFASGTNETADTLVKDYWKRTHGMTLPGKEDLAGAGIFRKDWHPGGDKKTKAGHERDPLADYNKSLDQKLRYMLGELDEEESGLKRSLERREKSYEAYVFESKRLEENKHRAIIASMVHEAEGIDKIKDATEKALATRELSNKQKAEERRHKEAIAKIDDETIARTRQLAEMVFQFEKAQRDQLKAAEGGSKTALDAVREFQAAYLSAGGVLDKRKKEFFDLNAILIEIAKNFEKVKQFMGEMSENGMGPPDIKFPEPIGEQPSPDMPAPPKMEEDPILKWRRLAEDLSYDITYTIDGAIRKGFEDGVGAGVKEFFRGLAEIAHSEALEMLRRAIAGVFGNDQGSGGSGASEKGNIFSTLIRTGVGLFASLFGGGSSGGLGSAAAGAFHAGGGYVSPGQWYFAGDRGTELIKSGPHGDTIYPHGQSMEMLAGAGGYGGQTINIYAQDVRSAFSRETITQAKSKFARLQRGR